MKSAFWGEKSRASAVKGKPLGLVLSSGEVLGFWLVEMLSSPKCRRNQWLCSALGTVCGEWIEWGRRDSR